MWWGIGGTAIEGSRGKASLNLAIAPLKKGWNQISIYVVDDNPAVIDEDFRAKNMTKTRQWVRGG